MMRVALALAVAALSLALPTSVFAQPVNADQPIFDVHIHYNRDAWGIYSADDVLSLMDQAGVQKAFVSSTPDDGTLLLYQRAPDRVVPGLRPYRIPADQVSWT